MAAMFASLKTAAAQTMRPLLEDIDHPRHISSVQRRGKGKRKPGRSWFKRNFGDKTAFETRRYMSDRYYRGESVPDFIRETLDTAVELRGRKAVKRARMFRRQEESKRLSALSRLVNYDGNDTVENRDRYWKLRKAWDADIDFRLIEQ